ncbi:MAG TPA: flagellar motor protein MotB [Nitrospirota bacterium]|nr:flagellar motor protein MotB [Nitrospirota bacterium]
MEENERDIEARVMRPFTEKQLRERHASQNDFDSNWLITLSDVLSLLLVFFVVFTIMAKSTKAAAHKEPVQEEIASAPTPSLREENILQKKMLDEVRNSIVNLRMENGVSVEAADREIVITLKEKVAFRPAEAEPLRSSEPILDDIARIIREHPLFLVDIEGHTDNVPIRTNRYPSNWELSVARATNVLKYFINRHRMDPSRFSVKGNADQKPLVENDTPENRARNRRVEIRLKEKDG